jgi:hypothetical protein
VNLLDRRSDLPVMQIVALREAIGQARRRAERQPATVGGGMRSAFPPYACFGDLGEFGDD